MNNELFNKISMLDTEVIAQEFENIDIMQTNEILSLINSQDSLVPAAVGKEISNITEVVDLCVKSFLQQGRLIYLGAGTSGRLGILDAAECPPTFGTSPQMVQGLIAGGHNAVFSAIEGAEDNQQDAVDKINELQIDANDVVCGLAASGRTPWVLSGLQQAKILKAVTVLITTNTKHEKLPYIDKIICPNVGAEVIAGSTRMKSATAQKLVLNMITTAAMIQLGKTYKNIMVDLQPLNGKLRQRSKRIVMEITGVDLLAAEQVLIETNYNVKLAIVRLVHNLDNVAGEQYIAANSGKIRGLVGGN